MEETERQQAGRRLRARAMTTRWRDWEDWLQTHRVELNAMTTPQLIAWLDEQDGRARRRQADPAAGCAGAGAGRADRGARSAPTITERILREAGLDDQVAAAIAADQDAGRRRAGDRTSRSCSSRKPDREWRDHIEAVVRKQTGAMSPRPNLRVHFRGVFSAILIKRRIASGRDSGLLCPDSQSSTAASSSGGSLTPISGTPVLSKVQSVDQRMRLGNAVSAFANCGRAVAHVRGSYVPATEAVIPISMRWDAAPTYRTSGYSKEKILFQSFFMLITVQFFFFASS